MTRLASAAFALSVAFAPTASWAQHEHHKGAQIAVIEGPMNQPSAFTVSLEKETVVQLHGTGPWGVTYLNAAEDPRNQ